MKSIDYLEELHYIGSPLNTKFNIELVKSHFVTMTFAVHSQSSVDTILKELQSLQAQDISNASLSPIVEQLMSLENKNLTTENVRTLHQIGQSLSKACLNSSLDERFANLAAYILTYRQLPDKRGLLGSQIIRESSLPRSA